MAESVEEMMANPTEESYGKAAHDREHKVLQPDTCVWCRWEMDDMESETVGGAVMGWTQNEGSV